MQYTKTALALGCLIGLVLAAPSAAREVTKTHYGPPIGVTEPDLLRVIIAPAPPGGTLPKFMCELAVSVAVLDAKDMAVLDSRDEVTVLPGDSFVANFAFNPGPPPARQEVVVQTTLRALRREAATCPLVGSMQLVDRGTGRTVATDVVHSAYTINGTIIVQGGS